MRARLRSIRMRRRKRGQRRLSLFISDMRAFVFINVYLHISAGYTKHGLFFSRTGRCSGPDRTPCYWLLCVIACARYEHSVYYSTYYTVLYMQSGFADIIKSTMPPIRCSEEAPRCKHLLVADPRVVRVVIVVVVLHAKSEYLHTIQCVNLRKLAKQTYEDPHIARKEAAHALSVRSCYTHAQQKNGKHACTHYLCVLRTRDTVSRVVSSCLSACV